MNFQQFDGERILRQLHFRKRYYLFGESVCEGDVVIPLAEAGFMVGCALAITESKYAGYVLGYSTKPYPWRQTYEGIVEDLWSRFETMNTSVSETDFTRFEKLFPELYKPFTSKQTGFIQNECISTIGQYVILGLITGMLSPDIGKQVIESWVSRNSTTQTPGIQSIRVQERPVISSLDDTQKYAVASYEEWKSTLPDSIN